MPSLKKHVELSLKRTGKDYREVHEWMDGQDISYKTRVKRHSITSIPEFMPIIKERFGDDGLKEYLQHIKDDYDNDAMLIRIARRIKLLFSKSNKPKKQ